MAILDDAWRWVESLVSKQKMREVIVVSFPFSISHSVAIESFSLFFLSSATIYYIKYSQFPNVLRHPSQAEER